MKTRIIIIFLLLVSIIVFSSQYSDPEFELKKKLDRLEKMRNNPPKHEIPMAGPLFSRAFPPKEKMSDEAKQLHVENYFKKYKNLGLDILKELRSNFYYFKINLDSIERFKEFGIDPLALSMYQVVGEDELIYDHLLSKSLFSTAVVSCKILKIEKNPNESKFGNKNTPMKKKYILEVIKFHKGVYLYNFGLDTLILYSDEHKYTTYDYETFGKLPGPNTLINLCEDDKVILFLSKYYYDSALVQLKNKFVEKLEEYFPLKLRNYVESNKNMFFSNDQIWLYVINNNRLINIEKEYLSDTYDNYIKKIERLEKINDTPNFYNRSFK